MSFGKIGVSFVMVFVSLSSLMYASYTMQGQTVLHGVSDDDIDDSTGGGGGPVIPPGHLTLHDIDESGLLTLHPRTSTLTYRNSHTTVVRTHDAPPDTPTIKQVLHDPVDFSTMVVDLTDMEQNDFIFEVSKVGGTSDDKCLTRLVDLDAPDQGSSFLVRSDYIIGPSSDGKSFVLRTKVRNLGTVDEHVTLTASIRDYFGGSYRSVPIDFVLPSHDEMNLTLPMGAIPRYRMRYNVTLHVTYSPDDPLGSDLKGDMLRAQGMSHFDSFFLFPWWLLWIVCAIIVIYGISHHIKKKKQCKTQEKNM